MNSAQRDTTAIANSPSSLLSELLRPAPLTDIEDRRQYHPDDWAPPLQISGRAARFVVDAGPLRFGAELHRRPWIARDYYTGAPRALQVPIGVKVYEPFKVLTCVRRRVRRSVMFAKKKMGLGSKQKRRRYNQRSGVRCGPR